MPPHPTVGPGEILPFAASRHPEKIALVVGDTRFTYRELATTSKSIAAELQSRGIGHGDTVSLYGQNSWQWIAAYHGILQSGAVVNPINVMLTGPELAFVLRDCGARGLFSSGPQLAIAESVLGDIPSIEVCVALDDTATPIALKLSDLIAAGAGKDVHVYPHEPQDLCAIGYTSGTTGHPKGAMQSQQAILLNCALTATMHGRTDSDIVVTALPAAHVYGNVAINSTLLAGGTVVAMERFDADRALELIESERATMFEGVPTMYAMMLADPHQTNVDLSSLRLSTIGGQTFSIDLLERWQQRSGARLVELWGMTELAGLGATHSVHAPARPGSIGVSLPGVDVAVAMLDEPRHPAPLGTHGELLVRGPIVMLGYHGRPDETSEVLDPNGWLRTGDVGYIDETGHVYVVDRIKDMIITGGYNIYPAEIERVLAMHPEVAMAAVGRRSDEVRGEIAVAYVVPKPGATPSDDTIFEHCRSHLAAYKRPRAVVFVDHLPTTSSGKLMRRKLAEIETTT